MKARYNSTRDVDNAKNGFMMNKYHMCWGCPYGTPLSDRFLCIFIEGSCAKFPQTIVKPDAEYVHKMAESIQLIRAAQAANDEQMKSK